MQPAVNPESFVVTGSVERGLDAQHFDVSQARLATVSQLVAFPLRNIIWEDDVSGQGCQNESARISRSKISNTFTWTDSLHSTLA